MKPTKFDPGGIALAVSQAISSGIGVSNTGGSPNPGDVFVADSETEGHWEALGGGTTGRWEVLMESGVTNPPAPLSNSDGDDWVYGFVTD